jgi:thiol-disulfide isomerase/thioredoxin
MNRIVLTLLLALPVAGALLLWQRIASASGSGDSRTAAASMPAPAPPVQEPECEDSAPESSTVADDPSAEATARSAQAPEPELDAAAELKKKGDNAAAAAAFEAWATAHPDHPRLAEALNEAGVCWSGIAKSQQKNGRNTPESLASYKKSLVLYGQAARTGDVAQGGRAQYLLGWNKYMMDDPAGAVAEFGIVLDKWKGDAKYVPKALERRSMANRAMLRTAAAVADLDRYMKEFPKGDEIESVKLYRQYCSDYDKPAPAIVAQPWIQGTPTTLEALRGQVVILVFFATWCPSCEQARPLLIDMHERWEPFGVQVLGILDDSQGQTPQSVKPLLSQKGYLFPVLFDGTKRAFPAYKANKIPNVVLVDRAGRIRWHDNVANLRDSTMELLLMEEPPAPGGKPAK